MGRWFELVRFAFILIILGLIAGLTACGSSPTRVTSFPVPANIVLAPAGQVSLDVGSFTQTFSATPRDNKNSTITTPISFQSSNTAVLTIANNGDACAGAWDSLTMPQICTPGPVGVAQVTATALGVSSPPTTVFVHQHIDKILVSPIPGQTPAPNLCFSQGQIFNYQATALSHGLDITPSVGPFAWQVTTAEVATLTVASVSAPISGLETGQAQVTAHTPGITSLFASVSSVTSQPLDFTTCAVQSITLAITGNSNSVSVTSGSGKTIEATVLDTAGNTITGVPLTWCSSEPATVGVGSGNCSSNTKDALAFTTSQAGGGTVTASCIPPGCNIGFQPPLPIYPAGAVDVVVAPVGTTTTPITVFVSSTGVSALGNCATTTGCVSTLIPIASPNNTVGTAVPLPATPNSMVFDREGAKAYLGTDFAFFGSRGLMAVAVASPPTVTEFKSVTGKVLTVSPDGKKVIVSGADPNALPVPGSNTPPPATQVIVFDTTSGTGTTLNIVGATAADFSPDNLKAYIVAGNTLHVFSTIQSLKSIAPLGAPASDVSFLANGAFAYLGGGAAAGVTVRATCSDALAPPVTTPAPPPFLKTVPNATQVLAVDSPGIDVIAVNTTPVGCSPTVSNSVQSFNLGQGSFVPTQLIVSQDGARAYVIASNKGSVLVFNVGNQTSSAIPLAANSIPIQASLTPDGILLYVAAADGQVHVLDTQAGTDIQQIPFPGDTTNPQGGFCTGVTFTCNPDLIAVRP
jgi:hypothetical protein